MDASGSAGKPVDVVAAVIEREGRALVARRPAGKRHGGMWEFPGGKLLSGESLLDAARRELREELALEVRTGGASLFHASDPGSPFTIHFIEVVALGTPVAIEHSALGWFTPAELSRIRLAPVDARFVREVWMTTGPVPTE